MDLVNWSLNAIDTIFSTLRLDRGERSCPSGTVPAGRLSSSWGWNLICLAPLSVEDVEDLYIFGFMITGFFLIGGGGYLVYRKVEATLSAVQVVKKLTGNIESLCRSAGSTQTMLLEMNRKLDVILTRIPSQERASSL